MRAAAFLAAFLITGPVIAEDPPLAAPDPQLLEFLGELAGEDAFFVEYTTSREAKRALKDAGKVFGDAAQVDDEAVAGVAWDALGAPTQAMLAGQAESWHTLPPARQRAMADGAQRWLAMDGIGRAQANERWQTWRSLTPEQRDRVRNAWARFRELTPEQQQAVRDAFMRFQELSPEQRDRVTERWERMSPEERRRAITRRQGSKPGSEDKTPCPPC